MMNFDFSAAMGMGQYEPGGSRIHRLVPGVKLISLILFMAGVLFSPLFPQLFLYFFFFCSVSRSAGLKIRQLLKGVKPVLPFLLLIGVIQVFFINRQVEGEPLAVVWHFSIFREDLLFTARLFGRFFNLVLLFSLFTAVTPLTEISHGTEALLRPFDRKGRWSHDLSLILTITFRFVPILIQEAEHITKAQASRGAQFGTWKTGYIKKIRLYFPLIIPLFIAALERAEILVDAMESRCYEAGTARTRLDEFYWMRQDLFALSLVFLVFLSLLFGGPLYRIAACCFKI